LSDSFLTSQDDHPLPGAFSKHCQTNGI